MSFKPDPSKAERARQDGNASFRKGRWTDAIAINNPEDAVPYTNRAAAYLKLDKYDDAERDCSRALEISPGHVKALYRRAMARKGLERYDEALQDLKQVLELEGKNEQAQGEIEEVEGFLVRRRRESEEWRSKARTLPPSPPRPTATIEEITDDAPELEPVKNIEKESSATVPAVPPSSFADLRKARSERKTYTASSDTNGVKKSVPPQRTAPSQDPVPAPTPLPEPIVTTDRLSQPSRPVSPPLNPQLTTSAAGFALLTKLSRLDVPSGWKYLRYYPSGLVPTILAPLLEPETLGQLLLVLRYGVVQDAERVKEILEGLKATPRWRINTAMLDPAEAQAGKEAWSTAGVSGAW